MRLIAFLVLTGCLLGAGWAAEGGKKIAVDEKVPDFTCTDLNGKMWNLSELQKGAKAGERRPVVLMFWCTTCTSCRKVEARFDKLFKDYKDKAVLSMLSVNAGESAKEGAAWAQAKGFSFPVLYDASGKSAELFKVTQTTTTLVIDKDGILRYHGKFDSAAVWTGEKQGKQAAFAEEALKAVLAGKAVETKENMVMG